MILKYKSIYLNQNLVMIFTNFNASSCTYGINVWKWQKHSSFNVMIKLRSQAVIQLDLVSLTYIDLIYTLETGRKLKVNVNVLFAFNLGFVSRWNWLRMKRPYMEFPCPLFPNTPALYHPSIFCRMAILSHNMLFYSEAID